MKDILLVSVESLRWDYHHAVPAFDGLDVSRCQTAGHYTRPALAGLLGGSVADALAREPRRPTLPGVLAAAGYETVGVCHSPQTTPRLGFDRGFGAYHNSVAPDDGPLARGSSVRERLGSHAVVRRLQRLYKSKAATLSDIAHDATAAEQAASAFESDGPTFAWVHLMESHRPYGWGDDALPEYIGGRAAGVTPSRWSATLSDTEAMHIRDAYENALWRVSQRLNYLLAAVGEGTVVAIVGDHGEELGEDGYWFHGPYRRRVVPTLAEVPLATRNLSATPRSAAALPAALAASVGVEAPASWHRPDDLPVTVAPWNGRTAARIGRDVTLSDAAFDVPESDGAEQVTQQLEALGYV